ncbi:NAD(P)-dependent dehydrogenase (short-subunit alcohol dehydrogenase family) [Actinocorallia herbida]|uniref:NAD(P)-dependent dehydrogenase (Short-subunit alcohol dehydrogenase family) n=1 Tax=Actinocorallia herbida TaxID=58109 RepID=A0A3N1D186_9ACTN|nr:SDR family oxidoreductase [Actinocorallia herbida]ROO87289.1 NAD(P)-dependent dehydrogenase (short-subunit alcohol dehydrogenase family) [Actinocorallia herbida]
MGQLDDKIALVTGGTSGIGRATAQRFADEGAFVFVTGRRQAELDATVKTLGGNGRGVRGDVSRAEDLEEIFAQIRRHGRGLDVLFANAGGGSFAALPDVTPEHFDETFSINVRGTLFTVQKSLALLNPGASVILAGSTAATSGTAAFGVYAASKAAIRSFARTWAVELADRGIRVNTIVPGPIETEGLRGLAPDEASADALVRQLGDSVPLGRPGRPEEVANAVLFLASDQSSFVTGSELFADGGDEQH